MGSGLRRQQVEERFCLGQEIKSESPVECPETTTERYGIGEYVILREKEGYHVSKGDQSIGSFVEGKLLEGENRALFKLDKGMLLEVTPKGHRQIFTREKARLHGYACADGTFRCGAHRCRYRGKDNAIKYDYSLSIADQDPILRSVFGNDAKKVYGVEPHDYPKRNEVYICGKEMAYDLSKYGPFGTHTWRVPSKHLDKEGYRMWSRGYFNGDGSSWEDVVNKGVTIAAVSVNRQGLEDVRALLRDQFGIWSGIYPAGAKKRPEGWSQAYMLQIKMSEDVMKFRDEIGFDGPKQQKLNELIRKYWGE